MDGDGQVKAKSAYVFALLYTLESTIRALVSSIIPITAYELLKDEQRVSVLGAVPGAAIKRGATQHDRFTTPGGGDDLARPISGDVSLLAALVRLLCDGVRAAAREEKRSQGHPEQVSTREAHAPTLEVSSESRCLAGSA